MLNLNNCDSALCCAVNALYEALLASEIYNDCVEDVTEMLQKCADYVNLVSGQEIQLQNARFRMEAEDYQVYAMNLDRLRRSMHDGLISSIDMINRLCGKLNVATVAPNVTFENRETYYEFAKEVVDFYFATAQIT